MRELAAEGGVSFRGGESCLTGLPREVNPSRSSIPPDREDERLLATYSAAIGIRLGLGSEVLRPLLSKPLLED